ANLRDDARAIRFKRKICERIVCSSAAAGDLFRGGGEFCFGARGEEDGRAFRGKKLSDGPADTPARSSNQRHIIFKEHRKKRIEGGRRGGKEESGGMLLPHCGRQAGDRQECPCHL